MLNGIIFGTPRPLVVNRPKINELFKLRKVFAALYDEENARRLEFFDFSQIFQKHSTEKKSENFLEQNPRNYILSFHQLKYYRYILQKKRHPEIVLKYIIPSEIANVFQTFSSILQMRKFLGCPKIRAESPIILGDCFHKNQVHLTNRGRLIGSQIHERSGRFGNEQF